MITNSKLNIEKIKTVFRTMEYNVIKEDTSDVESWLKRQDYSICAYGIDYRKPIGEKVDVNNVYVDKKLYSVYVPEDDKKDDIDYTLNATWLNTSNSDRATLMRRFALKIEENADFICKIESLTRGLLPKDTKKHGISLLVEYLRYFANWTYSSNRNQLGSTIIYVTDNTCLGALGFALGPALARGSNVILQTEPSLCACVSFLIELFLQVTIWDGVLKLIPTKNVLWTPAIPKHMIYLLGNIQYENNPILYSDNKVISVSNSKSPIIIFNNSDIDSACECVISAVWEYGGMLPWSADTILVQEDIYSEFVEKLKQRLEKVIVRDGINILADISKPPSSAIKKLRQMVDDARVQGIDVHQPQAGNIHNTFKPTLFIGMKVYNNNVIDECKNVSPAATIVAFRTPKEAIALANNNRQGFAASVWCDNIALINEITPHLNVGTVWLNSHGIIRASVPFTTYKADGVGYIGGSLGFYEYDDQHYLKPEYTQLLDSIRTATFKAKESQTKWNTLTLEDRIRILLKCTEDLEQHKSEKITEEDIEYLRKNIYGCITKCSSINNSRTINGFELIVKREAVGVVVYSVEDSENIPLILGALLLGNAVVLVTRTDLPKYQTISRLLPPGLLSVVRPSEAVWLQSDSRTVFVNIFRSSSNVIRKVFCELKDWDSIVRRCTLSKNIWMPVGDSI